MVPVFPVRWGGLILALPLLVGCKPEPQITRYQVPKPESIETPASKPGGGMPAAMEPGGSSASPDNLSATAPEGWREKTPGPLVLKAWEVTDGEDKVEFTISMAGGDMIQNMNRWRGQIGLPSASEAEIAEALKDREVNGQPAKFIEMHQPEDAPNRQSIMGVVIPVGGQNWFIKLRGSTKLAEQERERFEAFAQSVKW